MLHGFEDKRAQAECRIGFCLPNGEPKVFEGTCQGEIVGPRGDNGFGWDPIFQPMGHSLTFAELDAGIKNEISHRKAALMAFKAYIDSKPEWLN